MALSAHSELFASPKGLWGGRGWLYAPQHHVVRVEVLEFGGKEHVGDAYLVQRHLDREKGWRLVPFYAQQTPDPFLPDKQTLQPQRFAFVTGLLYHPAMHCERF